MSQDESYLKMYLNLWKTLLKRRSVLLIRYWLHVLCVYRKHRCSLCGSDSLPLFVTRKDRKICANYSILVMELSSVKIV